MSFAWLILHNVWAKKVRSLLTALAVAVGVLTVVSLGVVTDSIRTTASGVLELAEADFVVAQEGIGVLDSALTETQLDMVRALPGVDNAIGVLLNTSELGDDHPLLIQIGVRPEDVRPMGVRISAGQEFDANAEDEVMVGVRLAQDLELTPGDSLEIDGEQRNVVGVFNTGSVFGDGAVMFPLVPFQAEQMVPAGLSLFFVQTSDEEAVADVQQTVDESSPLLTAIRDLVEFGQSDPGFELITAIDQAAMIIAIAIGALVVMNTMLLSLVERYREFGVIRALGWSRRRLVALVLGEAMLIAFVGAGVGVGLGLLTVWVLSNLPDLLGVLEPIYEPWIFGRALITAIAVTGLGVMYPALRAARLSPQEAMRRE